MKTGEENLGDEILEYLLTEGDLRPLAEGEGYGITDSPIESLLLKAVRLGCFIGACDQSLSMRAPKPLQEFQMETQKQIGAYRVDFLFTAASCIGSRNISTLVVECDGHDYHERTKDQARSDRSRDRALQEMGHTVFRFTGSEIYRAPLACARQIFRWIDNATWKDVR